MALRIRTAKARHVCLACLQDITEEVRYVDYSERREGAALRRNVLYEHRRWHLPCYIAHLKIENPELNVLSVLSAIVGYKPQDAGTLNPPLPDVWELLEQVE